MAEETRTWIILGRRLTVQASPQTIAQLDEYLTLISQKADEFRQTHAHLDELTHWLMGLLSLLELLTNHLRLYADFCQRIESLIPSHFLSPDI
ncbi:MAG: hypothetical protein RMK19_06935 [Bacteroidia bacterium]|nr:hypothetical protein [Bacteroidia bacterium]MDW8015731.1 hypothetical protein [Bacteroidia bacterium]